MQGTAINGVKKLYKEDKEKALKISDELIKNTYRILMIRGFKGCYIWCEDNALSNYFKERLNFLLVGRLGLMKLTRIDF